MGQPAPLEIGSRDKILDAAETLFAKRGYSGVGMREVAEAVGFSKSSLFHHFRSKAELHAAVVTRILEIFEHRLAAALTVGGGDPIIRFDRWLDTLIDTFAEHPTWARLFLRSLFEDDELTGESDEERRANASLARLFAAIGALLREGMEVGAFRLASIPHTLQSLVGLTVYHFASGEFGDELVGKSIFAPSQIRKRKDEVRALLHHGLATPAALRRNANHS